MSRIWPDYEIICRQLQHWAQEHPNWMTLETLGRTALGRPLLAAVLTAADTDPEEKQHVLLTALHSGVERSGSGSVLATMEWLLSPEPVAREVLRRQVVVCMPVVNPDGYAAGTHTNSHGKDPYTHWNLDGPLEPESMPESVAVQTLMDRWQPELLADVHGLDESFEGYMSLENSGFSYSNSSLRPYQYDLVRRMDAAALAGGYPSDRLEQDGERMLWGPELDEISHKLWWGRPRHYAATYCYNRYHSLTLASECMWEDSGLLRHRALLKTGNTTWSGEYYPGYPTRVIMSNVLHQVAAYGDTVGNRRRSRVELWERQGSVLHGPYNPQMDGCMVYACATSPAAADRWLGDRSLEAIRERLPGCPGVDAAPILALLDRHPSGGGQWGPEPHLYLTGGERPSDAPEPIRHGLALRLRIPYSRARVLDVRLNGHELDNSPTDGFISWRARGYVYVQANIPPPLSANQDLFIVTVEYDPCERRRQGWVPPILRSGG